MILQPNRGAQSLVRIGVPETVAMKISGHRTRSGFDPYHLTSEKDLKEATDRQDVYIQRKMVTLPVTLEEAPGRYDFFLMHNLLKIGGEGGDRTHGPVARTAVFETARFGHSRTSPLGRTHPTAGYIGVNLLSLRSIVEAAYPGECNFSIGFLSAVHDSRDWVKGQSTSATLWRPSCVFRSPFLHSRPCRHCCCLNEGRVGDVTPPLRIRSE